MTARLRGALRERADQVEPYDLYRGAIDLARRRRRRGRILAAAAAVLAVALTVIVPLDRPGQDLPAAPPGTPGSLPDEVGVPLWGTSEVEAEPIGAASVVFGAPDWWPLGSKGDLALVGAHEDVYGISHDPENFRYAGEHAVLSPDGTRLATVGSVIDLGTGDHTPLPRLGADLVVPQAWSPGGRLLAVTAYTTDDEILTSASLYLVDPGAGTFRVIRDLDPRTDRDGYTVAFSRDGGKLAYQTGAIVAVTTVDGQSISRFTAADGSHLAGKGAWTPDGAGLTLLRQSRCCDGADYPSRWKLTMVDAITGEERSVPAIRELTDLVAVRLLGWSRTGEAVVTASHPFAGIDVAGFETGGARLGEGLTDYEWVRKTEVWAVSPFTTPRTLLTGPDLQIRSVDVADDVISGGLIRAARPPSGLGPHLRNALILTVAGLLALLAIRLRKRRRGDPRS
ncbi:hypothetical protein FHR83_006456 [Actinoplanes campanulatus]|uniref:WD40-like Beta Propeller Repeat n=1 Tax=Actinoplanes campanulatus TaxID=113559 RepID=A0A7W5FHS0_9ACTN|nr:hypothetical protein [Actinoplanes campanulatus]MBB3098757.1 hypothetical protein [Actinoplanes campanulatus]GGN37175.1 hypothetical protein GCM10010109_62890 [Actinoplanes campanulatus]GID40740.1 hypothetical protein Aca09nite_72460 [Actinoplanes campanulatus]